MANVSLRHPGLALESPSRLQRVELPFPGISQFILIRETVLGV